MSVSEEVSHGEENQTKEREKKLKKNGKQWKERDGNW